MLKQVDNLQYLCIVYIMQFIEEYSSSPESCPSLTSPDNGMIQCSGFFVDDICVFTCDDGYELSGSGTRTCQDGGTWTGTEAECTEGLHCVPFYCMQSLCTIQTVYAP